jgi:cobalt-zinc-cadmium efflux system membrane fusion protein
MNKIQINLGFLVAAMVIAAVSLWARSADSEQQTERSEQAAAETSDQGPNGGRMLRDGDFAIELQIVEAGIPPEFRVYAYDQGNVLEPESVLVEVILGRLGNIKDSFAFVPEGAYQRGIGIVREPHSFDVYVTATHASQQRQWHYQSYEGRTQIPDRVAQASGIETEAAGPQQIVEQVELTGVAQADPARVSEVRSRFPGLVTKILHQTGDQVAENDTLALVETNESLRSVPIKAPISGLLVSRNIQVGQVTGDEPLFVIADLSELWVQLDVFGRDLKAIRAGQTAEIRTLDDTRFNGPITYVSPLVAHGSQSIRARIPVPNPEGSLRAGQFVQANITVAETDVPLAVRRSALQTFRDFDVVYAKVGDEYEVRMLSLGRSDGDFVEVLGGLKVGEIYVSKNSYLVKADIEKSGASHDH